MTALPRQSAPGRPLSLPQQSAPGARSASPGRVPPGACSASCLGARSTSSVWPVSAPRQRPVPPSREVPSQDWAAGVIFISPLSSVSGVAVSSPLVAAWLREPMLSRPSWCFCDSVRKAAPTKQSLRQASLLLGCFFLSSPLLLSGRERVSEGLVSEPVFFFSDLFVSNWRIIALQRCVGLCLHQVCTGPRPREPPSHPPRLSQGAGLSSPSPTANPHRPPTWHRAGMRVSMPPSQLSRPPSPAASKSLFSVSVSPPLPCRQEHQHHLSRFLICVLMNDISVSLSDLLPSHFAGSRFSLIGVFSNVLRKRVPFSFQPFLHVFLLVCTGNDFIRHRQHSAAE